MAGYEGSRSPTPPGSSSRTLELMLGNSEQIEVDLDNLPLEDEEFEYLRGCVKESDVRARECTHIAQEYWRRGHLDKARALAEESIQKFKEERKDQELPPLYYLQANLSLSYARQAPKFVLPDDQQDKLSSKKTRSEHIAEATGYVNAASKAGGGIGGSTEILGYLTRGTLAFASRQGNETLQAFDGVLSKSPHNIVALLGKARFMYTQRQYREALRLFQTVLQLRPDCKPDPRVGIGLCFWALDDKERARMAWERSVEVDPGNTAANLLLGLYHMNFSKEAGDDVPQEDRQQSFVQGSKLLTSVFKAATLTSVGAAAASAVAEVLQRQGHSDRSLKLAERAIQFSDTLAVLADGHIRAARACQDLGLTKIALRHYTWATESAPTKVLAWIGKAQMHLLHDEIPAAIHSLDTALGQKGDCVEANIMLASICSNPGPSYSSTDAAADRKKARDIFDKLGRVVGASKNRALRYLGDDPDIHVDIAALWQNENLDRAARAYREASRIRVAQNPGEPVDPRLLNNLGVVTHLEGDLAQAQALYEDAITSAATAPSDSDSMISTIMYNLARVYEEQGESNKAREAYEKLLGKHPEYVDAKIGRARMLTGLSRHDEAHQWVKQALEAEPRDFNIRAFYTWFFYNCGRYKEGADFTSASLKQNPNDVYNLCAYGWFMHHAGREGRQRTDEAQAERMKTFTRAATSFSNALTHDPSCAVAAQGLAMIVAEDLLDSWAPGKPISDQKAKSNAREALAALTKIKESLNDGSVYINMGHCYFVRDDFERAIESYETASHRFYHGTNSATLLYLCRSWYAKANKDKSFSSMKTALKYGESAFHLQPQDKSILYNIAMIEQKALEMMVSVEDLSKRTSPDLEMAIEHAKHAQKLFNSLASDESKTLPYSKDLADQRRKYGESLLRRAEDHLSRQYEYERENAAQVEAARKAREDEAERLRAIQKKQKEEEARRQATLERRELTRQLMESYRADSDDDEDRKARRKPSAKKTKVEEGLSGDEEAPLKKRRGPRRKKNVDEDGDEPMTADPSDGEEKPRQKKARAKKRIVQDDEDGDEEQDNRKRRKTEYKSKEFLSDTDED
ncbi:hypothetical protein M407DRAFT_84591 [Tulasnella calospora MUT 4182]|uniref:TPR-like protein n=1 Tax=Tulasnella calospora MUT 4182 TaxID=1051891 RepID=A0A0C3K8Z4_9AGAM|nr:hypothetical protein M407DRAFT_84591 [Tulasnella calospora MUT 4182]